MREKFKLFREINIKVYWLDPVSHEEKSGILWNYAWVDSVVSVDSYDDRVIPAGFYEWNVKGDDGKWYLMSETELYLDSKKTN